MRSCCRNVALFLALYIVIIAVVVNFFGNSEDGDDYVYHREAKSIKNVTHPLVMWHGMGDNCCNAAFGMKSLEPMIKKHIPGIHIHSLMIGRNAVLDTIHGFLMNVDYKVSLACDLIANDPKLKNGYNAIGFSQGSQFLRAVAQRCPNPPMKNLISIGGQHQGVYGLPKCSGEDNSFCDFLRKAVSYAAYLPLIRSYIVQTQYWHDPLKENEYVQKNMFIADINQEKVFYESYKENLMQLENFVMVKFLRDTMVEPMESQWFGFYKPGQSKEVQGLQDTDVYKKDLLGLQEMDRMGKLHFLSYNSDHLQFNDVWFINEIIMKFM